MGLKLKSISPSRIKTFDLCKFKYWLTYCCSDVTLKSNWGAAHGSLLHDILENYANHNDTDWMQRLYDGYCGSLNTKDREGRDATMESPLRWAKAADFQNQKPRCDVCPYAGDEICLVSGEDLDNLSGCPRRLFDGSVSMLEKVISDYCGIWPNILRDRNGFFIGTEYSYSIPIQNTDVPIIGIMDLVVEEDKDTIRIYDYKTGSWTQTYEECREDIQVKMYSLAARREFIEDINRRGYNYKNIILTFDYFTKNPITLSFSREEDEATELYVLNKIHEIENTDWITRIVKSNDDFQERWAWKCRSLCDTGVCGNKWEKPFKV